jgi:phosphohistidine phosphatase
MRRTKPKRSPKLAGRKLKSKVGSRPRRVRNQRISSKTVSKPARQLKRKQPPPNLPQPRRVKRGRGPIAPDPLSFIVQGLDRWWGDYLARLDHFRQSASAKNVHDLRVAIRRLTTVFGLIDRFSSDNIVRRAQAKLKQQLSQLSTLRDTHVEIVRMRGFLKQLPEMKAFYDELLDMETQNLKTAKRIRWRSDRKLLEAACNRAKLKLTARRTTSSRDTTRRIIESSIDALFDNLTKKLEKVTPSDYASIHRLRLAFKPLRYTLELLQHLLGLDRKKLRTATLLARVMGQIQDLEVLMKDLVESNWRKEKILAAVVEIWLSLERQKSEATQRFLRAIPKFGSIWKPITYDQAKVAPRQPQTLFVLRHGIAVTRGNAAYPLDSDRPLTSKGLKRMRRIANGMQRLHVGFDVILSSPYRRALETAFVVAREYEFGQAVHTNPALRPEVLPEEVNRSLLEKYSACRRILLVGHEPQLSALISTLTSGSAGARPLLKKGGLCKLQVDKLQLGRCATLLWLLTPRQVMNTA